MYLIVAGIIFTLGMIITLFVDGFCRAIAPNGIYENKDNPPSIIVIGFVLSATISVAWAICLPLIIFGGFIVFAGYKVGQLIGKYEIKRK